MQTAVVGLCVAWALWQVAGRYLPLALRQAARRWLATRLGALGARAWAQRLQQNPPQKTGACAGGCKGCSSAIGATAGSTGATPIHSTAGGHPGSGVPTASPACTGSAAVGAGRGHTIWLSAQMQGPGVAPPTPPVAQSGASGCH